MLRARSRRRHRSHSRPRSRRAVWWSRPPRSVTSMKSSSTASSAAISSCRPRSRPTSAYGLDLGVMDTPRNNTLLSKAQLDALNVQNPGRVLLSDLERLFGCFVRPAERSPHPRPVRRHVLQWHARQLHAQRLRRPDQFQHGGLDRHRQGPGQRPGRRGAGVGGSIDITTKMPSITKSRPPLQLEFDTQQKRIFSFDLGGPLTSNIAGRVSFTRTTAAATTTTCFSTSSRCMPPGRRRSPEVLSSGQWRH